MRRITHNYETKMKVIEMRLEVYTNRYLQQELGIKNKTQIMPCCHKSDIRAFLL